MSGGVRLGAFGWAMHTVYGADGKSKRRAFVVVMENNGRFAVIFGRTEPRPNRRFEAVSERSDVGKRMGLNRPTHFQGVISLLPADYEVRGYFVTSLADTSDPLAVDEYGTWLRIKALSEPSK